VPAQVVGNRFPSAQGPPSFRPMPRARNLSGFVPMKDWRVSPS
jgi:hypothetical protein